MTSILVVEDNALLASSLVRFLRDQGGFTVAAVTHSAEAALERLDHVQVDLALVDVALPIMNGIELVAALRISYPDLPCLMLSGHDGREYVARALAAGAKGYVVKHNPLAILEGVQRVLAGEIYVSKELQSGLLQ